MQNFGNGSPLRNSGRPESRQRSSRIPRTGKVVIGEHGEAVLCTVRKYSETGAVLTLGGWIGFPSEFGLYVEPDGVFAQCRVRRRNGSSVEVAFSSIENRTHYRRGTPTAA